MSTSAYFSYALVKANLKFSDTNLTKVHEEEEEFFNGKFKIIQQKVQAVEFLS